MPPHAPPTREQRLHARAAMTQARAAVHRANALEAQRNLSRIERFVARTLADRLPLPDSVQEWYAMVYVARHQELGHLPPATERDAMHRAVHALHGAIRGNRFDASQFLDAAIAGADTLIEQCTAQLQLLPGGDNER